ncbi:DUF5916 domain-containing protein [Planctobacterium marinum]|uniref:DUF5916 domain-containing protein n=1 Tax=Planctobacterium marinum TaxID=1631968 RepID=UPI001E48A876|nr:DUF5916 domain-containing protein [Planctobacterium marinum]MCC2605321.1 DUF5916 domain-containing protein [Planctobacterium marinum]
MKALIKYVISLLTLTAPVSVIASDIVIDGSLNEQQWQEQVKHTDNYQVIPQTLLKSDSNFYYQILTSEQGLYVAVSAKKKASPLRVRTQENDTLFTNDHIQIMLDMNNTQQTSYVFAINHQGYFYDGIYKQNKLLDLDWSNNWQYAVKTRDNSWITELYIPWSSMTFSIQEQHEFGVSVSRYDEANNATYSSIPANPSMNSFLQNFNKEVAVIKVESNFDIFPYISVNRDIANNHNSTDIGTEIFWKPTKNQQISATVNPDFGQVESDELVVNFSAIESFFSEKRPFFNDNQNIFDVVGPENLRVVHTPRIGGESYYDEDYAGDLDSAFKYTFGTEQLDLGLLSAFESSDNGNSGRDFWVLRGQYHTDASKLGVSINNVNTPSIDRKATIISTDINYAYSEDAELNLGIINSQIEQAQITNSDTGWWLTGSVESSEQQSHEFSVFSYGDELQLNDIGYVKRINRKQFEYEYEYQIPDLDLWSIRDVTFAIETEIKTNYDSEKLPRILASSIELVADSEFEYQFGIEYGTSGFDDLLTRGNQSVWLPSFYIAELEISSPEYDWGTFSFEFELGTEGLSGAFYNAESSVEQQFSDNILVGFTLAQYNSDSWFDWDEGNTVDEYNFTEQSIELSLDYQIAGNQELRLKFESVIGKAKHLNRYLVNAEGHLSTFGDRDDFSFSESAFQMRYKYALSQLTAFYLSYGFGGEFEDEIAKFGKRNLYKQAIEAKDAHNIFAKIRFHF